MTRTDFVLVTAIALFVAFCLGWGARWLVQRLTRMNRSDLGELDRMSHDLHEAEATRDQAIAYLQDREAEMMDKLQQTEADLRTARDGLRETRAENEALRAHLDRSRR